MEATTAVAIEEEEKYYDAADTQDVSSSNDQRVRGEKEEGNVGDSKPSGLESAKGSPSEPQEGKTKEDDALEGGKGIGEKKEEENSKQLIVYPCPLSYVTPEPIEREMGNDSKVWETPLAETLKGVGKRKKILSRKIGKDFSPEMWMKEMFKSNKKADYSLLESVNKEEFKKFAGILNKAKKQSFKLVTGHVVDNMFFLNIAKPKQWVSTEHMQVIMEMIWRRRKDFIRYGKGAMVDTSFIGLLVSRYPEFKACTEKASFDWGNNVKTYVVGKRKAGNLKLEFINHVDVVYTPMNWNDKHWVGLVIKLQLKEVEILDAKIINSDDKEVEVFMEPVLHSLPWVMKRYLPPAVADGLTTEPFTWKRIEGVYQNERSGDCGPCAAKFLEMSAAGKTVDELGEITDEDVDDFRKKYAMDCYVEFVGNAKIVNI